jgi:hypothetical protein
VEGLVSWQPLFWFIEVTGRIVQVRGRAKMDNVIKEIISPSGFYKVQIIKRSKDDLFTSQVFKWIEHDEEISEIVGEKGFWGVLYSATSLTDTMESCMNVAFENLTIASGEKIII